MVTIKCPEMLATIIIIVIPSGVPPTHFIKDLKLQTFADIGKQWKELVRIDYEIFGSVSFWRASGSASFHSGANIWYCVFYWCRSSVVFPFGDHRDLHHFIYICFFWRQYSYTLVPTVVSRVGKSEITFFFHTCLPRCPQCDIFLATLLHAGAHSGVACRNVANDYIRTRWCLQWCRL